MPPEAAARAHPSVNPVPGVLYEPLSGRAYVLGMGLEVFEVIRILWSMSKEWDLISQTYPGLTPERLQAAQQFYDLNSEIVDARLAQEVRSIEEVWEKYPQSRPPHRR